MANQSRLTSKNHALSSGREAEPTQRMKQPYQVQHGLEDKEGKWMKMPRRSDTTAGLGYGAPAQARG